MSGPDLPRPVPGSNAIGRFIIGVSPIGTIPAFDPWATIISQYANSPILTQLILNFNEYIDQTANLDAFFDLIWNVETAEGYGLDRWGRVVGVTRILQVQVGSNLGLEGSSGVAGDASGDPFGQSAFFSGAPLTTNFALADDAFRILIFAKALANISDGSIPSINQLLLNLFPHRGNCFVTDGLNMTMTYTFAFKLSAVELAILQQSGVLPKSCGVSAVIVQPP
jgi:hypothetical protein